MKLFKFGGRIYILLLVIFILLGAAGCSSKEAPTEAEGPKRYDFEPVTEVKEGRKNVYVVLKVLTSQYWQDVSRGIADAGKDCGVNVYVGASAGEGDWETQDELLEQAVALGSDAIILSPANSTMLFERVNEIHSQGIPVILADTILNDTNAFDTCYMTDNLQAGMLAAEEMIRLLKDSGVSQNERASVAIQITSVSSQTVIDRLAGFNQYWSANAPSSWIVLDEIKQNNGDKAVAHQNCLDFLTEYPDVKGMFGCNNSSTIGFVTGLNESKRSDVVLVGFDYADETAAVIADDDRNASTIVQNQYNMGYMGLKQAVEMMNGAEAEYKFFDTNTRVVNHDNYAEFEQEQAKAGESK